MIIASVMATLQIQSSAVFHPPYYEESSLLISPQYARTFVFFHIVIRIGILGHPASGHRSTQKKLILVDGVVAKCLATCGLSSDTQVLYLGVVHIRGACGETSRKVHVTKWSYKRSLTLSLCK